MKFCRDCNNFLYFIEEREKKAYLKCRSCPYEEEITKANPIVYEHDLHQDTSVQYSINPYLKHDPTLPRFSNMICPNEGCATRGKDSNIVRNQAGCSKCRVALPMCSSATPPGSSWLGVKTRFAERYWVENHTALDPTSILRKTEYTSSA
jgi:DNA-directed RNA polymerase subunit M/transcription elongation factor TFIIS